MSTYIVGYRYNMYLTYPILCMLLSILPNDETINIIAVKVYCYIYTMYNQWYYII